jgi:hypothetical protein
MRPSFLNKNAPQKSNHFIRGRKTSLFEINIFLTN